MSAMSVIQSNPFVTSAFHHFLTESQSEHLRGKVKTAACGIFKGIVMALQ